MMLLALVGTPGAALSIKQPNVIRAFLQCRLCDSVKLEGLISDVTGCDFASVNEAVTLFYSPLLQSITTSTFFRYFKVDLEKPCPFWHEDGQCMMEGCSVCTCDEREVPQNWLDGGNGGNGAPEGWISTAASQFGFGSGHDEALGRVQGARSPAALAASSYTQYLQDTEDEDDWTYIDDDGPPASSGGGQYGGLSSYAAVMQAPPPEQSKPRGVFINLLQNPEGFTGYAGPSARRVWRAIQEENCFSSQGADDQCLEKRTFHRLMGGLQASISTHIASSYFYPDGGGRWGTNVPLFVKAVGAHKDRVVNLYFTFLFVLRAVVKAQPLLQAYSFDTGNATEDTLVKDLVSRLTSGTVTLPGATQRGAEDAMAQAAALLGLEDDCDAPTAEHDAADNGSNGSNGSSSGSSGSDKLKQAKHISPVERCRHAFNEERLFVVNATDGALASPSSSSDYSDTPYGKRRLQQEFRDRFRNITRIMDCVSCEKCRVWGKLQILGIGTAIKVLLTPAAALHGWGSGGSLSRQEVVALINTLNQLATSVAFAANAGELELDSKIEEVGHTILLGSTQGVPVLLAACAVLYVIFCRRPGAAGSGSPRKEA